MSEMSEMKASLNTSLCLVGVGAMAWLAVRSAGALMMCTALAVAALLAGVGWWLR